VFEPEIARSSIRLDGDPIAGPNQDMVEPHVMRAARSSQSVRRPAQPGAVTLRTLMRFESLRVSSPEVIGFAGPKTLDERQRLEPNALLSYY
jgi:hypothetical protein